MNFYFAAVFNKYVWMRNESLDPNFRVNHLSKLLLSDKIAATTLFRPEKKLMKNNVCKFVWRYINF